MTLEQHFAREVQALRTRLAKAHINSFTLVLEASGRCEAGAVLCKVTLSPESWGGERVEGREIAQVEKELLRRVSWSERNAPLELEAPDEV